MAGLGERFGGACKALLEIDGRTFAEAAVAPFLGARPQPTRCVAGILAAHDREFDAGSKIARLLAPLDGEVVVLEELTPGPAVTAVEVIETASISGPVVICDCDHALDVQPVIRRLLDGDVAAVVPTWPLDGESVSSWCTAQLVDERIVRIAEKRLAGNTSTDVRGVIGCYAFADAEEVREIVRTTGATNLSSVISHMIAEGAKIAGVNVAWAEFFGDPTRLQRTLAERGYMRKSSS